MGCLPPREMVAGGCKRVGGLEGSLEYKARVLRDPLLEWHEHGLVLCREGIKS